MDTKPTRETSNVRMRCEFIWHIRGATDGPECGRQQDTDTVRQMRLLVSEGRLKQLFLSGSRQELDKRLQEYLSTGSLPLEPAWPIPRTLGSLRRQPVSRSMQA